MPKSEHPVVMSDFKSKSKDIAWIVSHCNSSSHREDYVNSMKNLTDSSLKIDIFGKCGNFKVHDFKNDKKDEILVDAAYKEIAKEYKFYLSLENSICKEYVTEKFFNALKYGILPITNGQDISSIAPPHSYLHIDDFKSPTILMETLQNISQNQDLYNSYFWWKEFYSVRTDLKSESQCQLCNILNRDAFKSMNDYSQFSDYWNQCANP